MSTYWAREGAWVIRCVGGVSRRYVEGEPLEIMVGPGWQEIPPPLPLGTRVWHVAYGLGVISGLWLEDGMQYTARFTDGVNCPINLTLCFRICS